MTTVRAETINANKQMKRLLLAALLGAACATARAQMVAVGTDVLMDALQTPSVGAELVVGERSSIGLSIFGNHNPWGKTMKVVGLQPEWRYYFSGRPMHSWFAGIGAVGAQYDITWKGKVYDGSALGAGLTFGYVISLTKRLNIDLHAGLGLIFYRQKEYFETDSYESDFDYGATAQSNAKGYTLLPTRIGVSVTYILK